MYLKNKTTKILILLLVILIILLGSITIKEIYNKQMIKKTYNTYTSNIDILIESKASNNEDLKLKINGNTIIGVIKIDKIKFEGLVLEGTKANTLNRGIGHFENTPVLNGNVCLAGHNYWNYLAKLHTLQNGDTLSYVSYLGTKEYEVFSLKEIDETDFSLLENTKENIITLITCIKNKPEKRLCVQAIEKNF